MIKILILILSILAATAAALNLQELRMHHERAPKSLTPAQPKGPENFQDPEPLFHAVFYADDRPGRVLVDKLGHIDDDKVQTGTPVEKPYPFIGAFGEIGFTSDGGITYIISCTSSLIDTQTILTAAHCINATRQTGKILIYVWGLSDVRAKTIQELQKKGSNMAAFDIERVYVHPNYGQAMISSSQASIVNDVAIARLYKPLQAEGTKPICLASSEITADLVGAGWGMKDCYQDSQETLRRAKGTVVGNEECNSRLRRHYLGVNAQHVCATFTLDNGESAAVAKGDSGGPLFSQNADQPIQIGVVSFGAIDFGPGGAQNPSQYCMMKDVPQVYARVSYFKNFIEGAAPNATWC